MYTNLFDAEARVAAIYPIEMIGDPENPPKWVEEMAENIDDTFIGGIIDEMPELHSVRSADPYLNEKDHAQALAHEWVWARRSGFIVHCEVCWRRYPEAGSDAFYSGWSIVSLCWIYAETLEEISAKVLAVATELHNKAKARAGAA